MTSPIYDLSDHYVSALAELHPGYATSLGIPGYDHLMPDFSPQGHAAIDELNRRTLSTLNSLSADTNADRLAAGVLRESLEAAIMSYDGGEHLRAIREIAGDVDEARGIFDLMPADTADHWNTIAERMSRVPLAFEGMHTTWRLGRDTNVLTSQRQVRAVIQMLTAWSGGRSTEGGFFTSFAESAASIPGAPMSALRDAAREADRALADTAEFLRTEYLPHALAADGVGPERHAIARRQFLGMTISADDAYQWGWEETMRLDAEIARVAQQIVPGASPDEVKHLLDTDPDRAVHGEENLRAWLQELMDDAMSFLIDNDHFAIDERIHRVEAMISPPGGAAAMYYTGPSEDLTRPGRTWYPANGRQSFPRWGEPTTAYHEGVPGHHLQVATAVINSNTLSRFQRHSFVSGHGEGWALYAERLMDEFGFFDNPEFRLGYLYAQAFRAARVVIDTGVHCGLPIPRSSSWHPGEMWNADLMLEFLTARSSSDDAMNRSEVNRYLGWPGQAISYKLGERVWLELRDEAQRKHGQSFNLRAWHAHALDLGNLGLDLLKSELRRY
jgi:uncharacterized protein (DUF885 family)